jgi:hypothetical protein
MERNKMTFHAAGTFGIPHFGSPWGKLSGAIPFGLECTLAMEWTARRTTVSERAWTFDHRDTSVRKPDQTFVKFYVIGWMTEIPLNHGAQLTDRQWTTTQNFGSTRQ